jgi:type II secretory pathway pseudopilin PulG
LQQAAEQQQARQQATQQAQDHQVKELLTAIQQAMGEFRQDPASLFEPLKKLALRLAEELVLGELSVSPQAIDRLVQRCVDTLDTSASTPLVIQLSPSDLALLREHPETESDRPDHWTWEVDASLLPGSVRIKANDTVVSDFVETRLTALAQSLLKPESAWTSQSAFNPARFAQRPSTRLVEDVEPRAASAFDAPSMAQAEAPSPAFATDTDTDTAASVEIIDAASIEADASPASAAMDSVWDSLPDLALEPESAEAPPTTEPPPTGEIPAAAAAVTQDETAETAEATGTLSADPAAPQDPEHA